MPRILMASDDRDLSLPRLRELLGDDGLMEMSDVTPSSGVQDRFVEDGVEVAVTPLDSVAETLARYATLGAYLDAVVLATIRPYRNRATFLEKAASAVRNINDTVAFQNGIRVNHLPIVVIDLITLLMPGAGAPSDLSQMKAPAWCYIQPNGKTLTDCLVESLAHWRRQLMQELEFVGYGITYDEQGQVEVAPVVHRRRESRFFVDSVSVASLRRTGYLRLPQDWLDDMAPFVRLQHTLNRVRSLPPKQQEPLLQECLDQNPELIYRGIFQRHWSQPRLRHPDPLRREIVPDFLLATASSEAPSWEIMEIKTSEEAIMNRGQFTGFFLKSMEQLGLHYADYFASPKTADEQRTKLGMVVTHPRKALLIGRNTTDEDKHAISEAQRYSDWNDISIITYDDLIETGYNRVRVKRRIDAAVFVERASG
jgi:hypothetical protein